MADILFKILRNVYVYITSVLDIGAGIGDDLMIYKKINPAAELFAIECYKPYIEQLNKKRDKSI